MKKLIRKWLGISESPTQEDINDMLITSINSWLLGGLYGKDKSEYRPLKYMIEEAVGIELRGVSDKLYREVPKLTITQVEMYVAKEEFLDGIITRIKSKQLGVK